MIELFVNLSAAVDSYNELAKTGPTITAENRRQRLEEVAKWAKEYQAQFNIANPNFVSLVSNATATPAGTESPQDALDRTIAAFDEHSFAHIHQLVAAIDTYQEVREQLLHKRI